VHLGCGDGRLATALRAGEAYVVHGLDRDAGHVAAAPADRLWHPPVAPATPEDWPVFRHDMTRSGATPTAVPTALERAWTKSVGGRLTAPVVADGALAWRYRAAPRDRRMGARGRLESVWPVSGAVLVLDGVVYASAGRSPYLDGGIFLVGLDARTGHAAVQGPEAG